jgi:hypothetical protein
MRAVPAGTEPWIGTGALVSFAAAGKFVSVAEFVEFVCAASTVASSRQGSSIQFFTTTS